MMRPSLLPLPLLLLPLLLLLAPLRPSVSVCVPRGANPIPYLYRAEAALEPPVESPVEAPRSSPVPRPSGFSPLDGIVKTVSKALLTRIVPIDPLGPICAYTDYPDVCLSSVRSHPLAAIDAKSVAGLQMKALVEKARAAIEYGNRLIADPAYGGAAACLKVCVDGFDDGLDDAEAAREALLAGDRGTARSMLSAMFGSFSCSDAFAEGEALGRCRGPSPMKEHEDALAKLVVNSLAIAKHLGH